MRLVFVHIIDDNFGDVNCGPKSLRPEWKEYPEYDFRNYRAHARADDVLIVGGGGMLHPGVDRWIQKVSAKKPVFVWGIGINYHDGKIPDLRSLLGRCERVTLRHRRNPVFEYCPCPSLARIEFLKYMELPEVPSMDMVFYSHKDHIISRESSITGIPELINSRVWLQHAGKDDLLSVLRFLGKGRIVVTNSYHGAVWAMALDRPVILWRPLSTRFNLQEALLRYPESIVHTADELRKAVACLSQQPIPWTGFGEFSLLHEARQQIMDEATRISSKLSDFTVPPLRKGHSRFSTWLRCSVSRVRSRSSDPSV